MLYYSHSFRAFDNTGLEFTIDVYTTTISTGSTDTVAHRGLVLQFQGHPVHRHSKGIYRLPDGTRVYAQQDDAP
jgi:hypothetical protein